MPAPLITWGLRAARAAAFVARRTPRAALAGAQRANEIGWAIDNIDRGFSYVLPHYRRVVTVQVWGNKLATKRKLYYIALSMAFGVLKPAGIIRSANTIRVRVDHYGRYVEVQMGMDLSGVIGHVEKFVDKKFVEFFDKHKDLGTAGDLNDHKTSDDIEAFRRDSDAAIGMENLVMGPSENITGGEAPAIMAMRIGRDAVFGLPLKVERIQVDPIGTRQQLIARKVGESPGPPNPRDGTPDYRTFGTDLTRVVTEALMDPWENTDGKLPLSPPNTAKQADAPKEWKGGGINLS